MKVGDRVKITAGFQQGHTGVITAELNYAGGGDWRVDLDGSRDWCYCPEDQMELLDEGGSAGKRSDGCECGSSAVDSPRHSYYCKLFVEEN
jgi:hypothetical protein